jgi:aldehyde:ferredoxin oxidoreductase
VDHLTNQPVAERGRSEGARDLIRKIVGDEKYAVPDLIEKRAEIVIWHEDIYAVTDALGFCTFIDTVAYKINPDYIADILNQAIGTEFKRDELMLAGRRILTLERAFNIREGFSRQHDRLPWRIMNEPVSEGPQKGHITDSAQLEVMLDDYYELNGWDKKTGIPRKETLVHLGLLELCADIYENKSHRANQ